MDLTKWILQKFAGLDKYVDLGSVVVKSGLTSLVQKGEIEFNDVGLQAEKLTELLGNGISIEKGLIKTIGIQLPWNITAPFKSIRGVVNESWKLRLSGVSLTIKRKPCEKYNATPSNQHSGLLHDFISSKDFDLLQTFVNSGPQINTLDYTGFFVDSTDKTNTKTSQCGSCSCVMSNNAVIDYKSTDIRITPIYKDELGLEYCSNCYITLRSRQRTASALRQYESMLQEETYLDVVVSVPFSISNSYFKKDFFENNLIKSIQCNSKPIPGLHLDDQFLLIVSEINIDKGLQLLRSSGNDIHEYQCVGYCSTFQCFPDGNDAFILKLVINDSKEMQFTVNEYQLSTFRSLIIMIGGSHAGIPTEMSVISVHSKMIVGTSINVVIASQSTTSRSTVLQNLSSVSSVFNTAVACRISSRSAKDRALDSLLLKINGINEWEQKIQKLHENDYYLAKGESSVWRFLSTLRKCIHITINDIHVKVIVDDVSKPLQVIEYGIKAKNITLDDGSHQNEQTTIRTLSVDTLSAYCGSENNSILTPTSGEVIYQKIGIKKSINFTLNSNPTITLNKENIELLKPLLSSMYVKTTPRNYKDLWRRSISTITTSINKLKSKKGISLLEADYQSLRNHLHGIDHSNIKIKPQNINMYYEMLQTYIPIDLLSKWSSKQCSACGPINFNRVFYENGQSEGLQQKQQKGLCVFFACFCFAPTKLEKKLFRLKAVYFLWS